MARALITFSPIPWQEEGRPGSFFNRVDAIKIASARGPPRSLQVCRPIGTCTSNSSVTRLQLASKYEYLGIPVLRSWDLTISRYQDHPPLETKAWGDKELPIDCRHFCVPGATADALLRRLHAMLHPPVPCHRVLAAEDAAGERHATAAWCPAAADSGATRDVDCLDTVGNVKGTPTCSTLRHSLHASRAS